MRYFLLAIVFMGIAAAFATTAVHAQLAFGPGGIQLGEPMVRHHRHYMSHEHGYGWAHEHYRLRHHHDAVPDYDHDEDEEE